MKCPHCERTEQQVKVGCNGSGSQRYMCQVCHRKYTPHPKSRGYPSDIRQQAVEMYVDGLNFRRIGRMLKVSHQTVSNWVSEQADRLSDDPPMPSGQMEVNEMDELFTFVGQKKTSSTSSPR